MKNKIEKQKRKLQKYFLKKILNKDFEVIDVKTKLNDIGISIMIDDTNCFNFSITDSDEVVIIQQNFSSLALGDVINKKSTFKIVEIFKEIAKEKSNLKTNKI